MEASAKTHQNKKQKIGEASHEDREDLGSSSDDRHVIQADFIYCLVSMKKTQRDSSNNRSEEYCDVFPQPFSRSLIELKDGTYSHNSSARACCVLMLDALVQRQENDERAVTYRYVNFRCEPHEQHGMVAFVEVDLLGLHSSQIGKGGRMNFKILVKIIEEPGIFFAFGSAENYGWALQPSLNRKYFYFRGLPLRRLAKHAVPTKPLPHVLDSPVEAHFMRVNGRKQQGDWSSLPALPLLMIMDRLDIFDSKRLTAVCRDWRDTSLRYPKNMHSVGDGVPWIWHAKHGKESRSREFICVPDGNRKFQVDMPEFAHSTLLFSKGGWILLLRQNGGVGFPILFLVNPFTRDKIELPKREEGSKNTKCYGSFTLRDSDGYPNRVILITPELPFQASIHTARPGDDEVWASHDYTGLERTFLTSFIHVTIGDNVYCQDPYGYISIFNVANNSVRVLPPVPSGGFISEHGGELIFVEHGTSVERKYRSFVLVHKYNGESSSWERLSRGAVMGTAWYLCNGQPVVAAAKGGRRRGLEIYKLVQRMEWSRLGVRSRHKCTHYDVCVTDLLTGERTTFRLPLADHKSLLWVAIG
ncbi:unnamed protein product [Cuscuta campestris]|uniref:F-box domain-containing protein n=1 Tax=Cuscuta campestris TaxID=132261 RepID=A0A484KKM6_9ASTE|nr:unnamed protein product [Cuscuta campestris]